MLSRTPEKSLFSLRLLLFIGWLGLIGSLFWDPVTVDWTRPLATPTVQRSVGGNADDIANNGPRTAVVRDHDPFRVQGNAPSIQGHPGKPQAAYAMGNRIWWTMVVPLLPLFLMVFGHEAWRRICPLSLASQLPRYFRVVRQRAFVQRQSGKVERRVALIQRDSWLDRNAWYVQTGLLFAGLTVRLLFANGNRTALAVFLLMVIGSAIVVGYLWGGKTWCNYFCPVNVVQKIYTEPRGIFESAAHLQTGATARLTQSVCRTPAPKIKRKDAAAVIPIKATNESTDDRPACVGCTSHCGDIDLERAYWDSLLQPARRNVYYVFYGLIVGFYTFYYLYSGNWDYYFSGYWTHETDQMAHLLDPGLFIAGHAVAIPKLLSAPLVLAACGAASLGIGKALESLYRRYRAARRKLPEAEIVNHCLSFSAFLSINTFYLFGGRPNLLMLPQPAIRVVDLLIIFLTTLWFFGALRRTPFRYRRESLAASLLVQLKKLKVDVSRYMEGRTIDDLQPDEVYVLSKVLPAFSREQKVQAYKRILDDMISQEKTSSAATLQVLQDLRDEMGISADEHVSILDELGHDHALEFDPATVSAQERKACVASYRDLAGRAIAKRIEEGKTLSASLNEPDFAILLATMRGSLQIDEQEHAAALTHITGAGGPLEARLAQRVAEIGTLIGAKRRLLVPHAAAQLPRPLALLLREAIDEQVADTAYIALSLMRTLGASSNAFDVCATLVDHIGIDIIDILLQPVAVGSGLTWKDVLDATLIAHIAKALSGADVRRAVDAMASDTPLAPPSEDGPHGPDAASTSERASPAVSDALRDRLLALIVLPDPLLGTPLRIAIALHVLAFVDADAASAWRDASASAPGDWHEQGLIKEVFAAMSHRQLHDAAGEVRSKPTLINVRTADGNEEVHSFDSVSVRIGASQDNDLCLRGPGIAGHHFLLRTRTTGVTGGPLGYAVAFLNGEPMDDDAPIRSGDEVRLGLDKTQAYTLFFTVPTRSTLYESVALRTVPTLATLLANGRSQPLPSIEARHAEGDASIPPSTQTGGQTRLSALLGLAARAQVRRYRRDTILSETSFPQGARCVLHVGELRYDAGELSGADDTTTTATSAIPRDVAAMASLTFDVGSRPARDAAARIPLDDAPDADGDGLALAARPTIRYRYRVVSDYADVIVIGTNATPH